MRSREPCLSFASAGLIHVRASLPPIQPPQWAEKESGFQSVHDKRRRSFLVWKQTHPPLVLIHQQGLGLKALGMWPGCGQEISAVRGTVLLTHKSKTEGLTGPKCLQSEASGDLPWLSWKRRGFGLQISSKVLLSYRSESYPIWAIGP